MARPDGFLSLRFIDKLYHGEVRLAFEASWTAVCRPVRRHGSRQCLTEMTAQFDLAAVRISCGWWR